MKITKLANPEFTEEKWRNDLLPYVIIKSLETGEDCDPLISLMGGRNVPKISEFIKKIELVELEIQTVLDEGLRETISDYGNGRSWKDLPDQEKL